MVQAVETRARRYGRYGGRRRSVIGSSITSGSKARIVRALSSAVLLGFAARSGRAQSVTPTVSAARLLGVFDSRTGKPLPGVQVRDAFTGTYALTTETGTVTLGFVSFRGNAAIVQLRKLGYEPRQLLLSSTDTTPITEMLEPATVLAPVNITEKYNVNRDAGKWEGFEQRCHAVAITCFRPDDLASKPAANLADLLVHAKNVTIGACGGGEGTGSGRDSRHTQCGKIAMHSSVIPPAYCQPTVFIDGFEWNPVIGAAIDLVPGDAPQAPYTPANVKAVEVYPPTGARPMRFSGDPTCGAIVIWTR
jgi:hypothetical protein